MSTPSQTFFDGVAATRARFAARQADRQVAHDEAQRAYEKRQAELEAERQRRRGPAVAPDELARQAAERDDEIAALRAVLAALPGEEGRLTAALTEAVRVGDLEAAIAAAQRRAALEAVRAAAGVRLRQLGLESDGRPRSPLGLR